MKDLDFDELDKAVNSLMQGGLKSAEEEKPAVAPSSEPVEPVSHSSAPIDTPPVIKEETVVAANSTAPPAVTPPAQSSTNLAPKRSGRFMDVMHPSSDMRPPLSMPARIGKEIAPMVGNVATSMPATEPVAETPVFETTDESLKVNEASPVDEVAADYVSDAASDATLTPDETAKMTSDQLDVPVSPFLSDAKVEKRPLGGSASIVSETEDVSMAESVDQALASSQPESPEVPAALPVELSGDVVSIESDATSHVATINQSETDPVGAGVAGNSSITQQYKEKENSGDQSHAPIYDTNVQPLAHPAKKKSGWGAVLWILLIILICVGIAAALYFMGIIRLPV
ncbi:MAG TPA: hypothetical protein VGE13_00680 [Candidatus Saccharimonadales bacterium]